MELWLGKEYLLENNIVILFVIYFFVHKWCDMLYVYQEAKGLWWENRFVPIIAAIVNLITNLILVNIIGLAGILISTIVSVLFIYDFGYAKVLFSNYFNIKNAFKEYIFKQVKYLTTTIIVGIITYAICLIIKQNTLIYFVLKMSIVTIIPNILFLLIYKNSIEYKEMMRFLKVKLLRIKERS
jgi:peptidoglycan biosynthesis protein MviN/MurJ (putative lipid II flippase)